MNITAEHAEHAAAGSLAEELPYWGFLPDGRTCLTRGGDCSQSAGSRPTSSTAGPRQNSTGCSTSGPGCCRPLRRAAGSASTSRARLTIRLPMRASRGTESARSGAGNAQSSCAGASRNMTAHVVWCHDPGLQQTRGAGSRGPWWLEYLRSWLARRRAPHESVYLLRRIEQAGERFRQSVEASRAMVDDLTPIRMLDGPEAGKFLSSLVNRPGLGWDGATGSGMNWRLAVSELEAERRYLRLDGEPVVLYSLLSPPGAARANLLDELYRLEARMTVALEWRPWSGAAGRKKIRDAQRHYFSKRYSMAAHVQETEGTSAAMEDSAAGAESDRLARALVELETDGVAYGEVSLTIALHGGLEETGRLDGDNPADLRAARCQGDPRRLRPALRLVGPDAGPATEPAVAARVHVGRSGGLPVPAVRPAPGRQPVRAPGGSEPDHAGDAVADPLPLRPVRRVRRRAHADLGRHRSRQELHPEFPVGSGLAL